MAALAVNKPGAGVDSGRQGSRGTAVVKVRELACSVLHLRPPFGSSWRPGRDCAAQVWPGWLRGLWWALQDFPAPPRSLPSGAEVAWSSNSSVNVVRGAVCEKHRVGL